MKRKCKIIFAAQNPGGFDAIAPIIKNLQKNSNFGLMVFLKNQSRDFAKKEGIKYIDANNLSFEEIKKNIKESSPNLIFTATSAESSIEKEIIKIANIKKIPTISIVDYWGNYKKRFGEKLEYLPDYILVIDEKMKKGMRIEGIPENRIFITGNPHFDRFSDNKILPEDKNLIVFYSQPFSEQSNKDFNEIKIFDDVIKVLEKIYPKKEIIVKFHPKEENHSKFNETIKSTKLKIKIEEKLKADDLSKKAGLIIGINSMALFDAVLMQKKVLSYQPNQKKEKDTLISNIYSWSVPVYKNPDLLPELKNIYTKSLPKKELLEKYTKNKSTQKVINFINLKIN